MSCSTRVRCAVVSTYPPTPCGLATFTQALVTHLSRLGVAVDVVRLVDRPERFPAREVVHNLVNDAPHAASDAAAMLNTYDFVIVQHEYGIYAGMDGDAVLAVMGRLRVPVIAVLHTVLVSPTAHQRAVLQTLVSAAHGVVTMTSTAQHRLLDGFDVEAGKVHVIPHGAAESPALPPMVASRLGARNGAVRTPSQGPMGTAGARGPLILTWGLLGPGKGIEWGIEALARLRDLAPRPLRRRGQTHPRVLEREGEAYRDRLEAGRALGVADMVAASTTATLTTRS